MLEIEKKYRLSAADRDRITAQLKRLGGVFEGDEREENTIYGGESLEPGGSIVRIRRTEHRALLTYKRRIEEGADVKQQIEYETEISDPNEADKIIRQLGLTPKLVYEKHRSTWRFRNVEVVFDNLPFGDFMEIEGSRTAIREAEMLLDLDSLETEHETYPRLTARLGTVVGEVVEARFN